MSQIKLQELSQEGKVDLLKRLEKLGSQNLKNDLYSTLLSSLKSKDKQNKEFLTRYLLLVAILDQQAESTSARQTVIKIYEKYGNEFFMKPENFLGKIKEVLTLAREVYNPKSRVIRMRKEGIIMLRIGGYMLALVNLINKHGTLVDYFKSFGNPENLLKALLNDVLIGGLFFEKALRMYIGWISHPNLYVNIFDGKIQVDTIPMVVDGHVCKVMARTGFLSSVKVEKDKPIVTAESERKKIENLVRKYYPRGDYFMIDYGAFYVGINFCKEDEPRCNECPIAEYCMRNTYVRAY